MRRAEGEQVHQATLYGRHLGHNVRVNAVTSEVHFGEGNLTDYPTYRELHAKLDLTESSRIVIQSRF